MTEITDDMKAIIKQAILSFVATVRSGVSRRPRGQDRNRFDRPVAVARPCLRPTSPKPG